jgi:chemotaxis protein histidine kinase CheA
LEALETERKRAIEEAQMAKEAKEVAEAAAAASTTAAAAVAVEKEEEQQGTAAATAAEAAAQALRLATATQAAAVAEASAATMAQRAEAEAAAAAAAAADLSNARAALKAAEEALSLCETRAAAAEARAEEEVAEAAARAEELVAAALTTAHAKTEAEVATNELAKESRAHARTAEALAASQGEASSLAVQVQGERAMVTALKRRHDATVAELDELKGSVRVFCRLRPLKMEEGETPSTAPAPKVATDGGGCRTAVVSTSSIGGSSGSAMVDGHNGSGRSFEFDRVFGADEASAAVFDELRPLTRRVHAGASATVLAYGQTGSGKTYTVTAMHSMVVNELLEGEGSEGGALMQAAAAEGAGGGGGRSAPRLAMCAAEVYLDSVRDLAPAESIADAAAKATSAQTPTAALTGIQSGEIALTWQPITDAVDAAAKVEKATLSRKTADNGLNATSSRSHLVVVYAVLDAVSGERRGQMALVDLAGSERLARTEATGERRDEAVSINKSLSALGDVLHSLIGKESHVPYR